MALVKIGDCCCDEYVQPPGDSECGCDTGKQGPARLEVIFPTFVPSSYAGPNGGTIVSFPSARMLTGGPFFAYTFCSGCPQHTWAIMPLFRPTCPSEPCQCSPVQTPPVAGGTDCDQFAGSQLLDFVAPGTGTLCYYIGGPSPAVGSWTKPSTGSLLPVGTTEDFTIFARTEYEVRFVSGSTKELFLLCRVDVVMGGMRFDHPSAACGVDNAPGFSPGGTLVAWKGEKKLATGTEAELEEYYCVGDHTLTLALVSTPLASSDTCSVTGTTLLATIDYPQ